MTEGSSSFGAQHPIAELAPPPSAYTESVRFTDLGGRAELRCVYERNGSLYAGGFVFNKVRAYRFRADGHSTVWHVDAYNTLVEVESSSWVHELRQHETSESRDKWGLRHFMIFVDSFGAYEVAAEDWEQLPEGPSAV
jgi:hypothetical protein